MQALLRLGYDIYSAIYEHTDNAFDAKANSVTIAIRRTTDDYIIEIEDDGCGMSRETLREALRLGSKTEREAEDLGKYGMGLVTGGFAMGKRIEIWTTQQDDSKTTHYAMIDLDQIRKDDAFNLVEDDFRGGDSSRGHHGTIVRISKADKIGVNPKTYAETLRNNLGRIYRYYIASGKEIKVIWEDHESGKDGVLAVGAIDPLMKAREGVIRYSAGEVEIKTKDGVKDTMEVEIFILPQEIADIDEEDAAGNGIHLSTQGISVVRNMREISSATWLGIERRHPGLNRVRVEIRFPSVLDEAMGVRFTKDGVGNLPQSTLDVLKAYLSPQLKQIKADYAKSRALTKTKKDVDHSVAEHRITKLAMMLPLPTRDPKPGEKRKEPVHKPDRPYAPDKPNVKPGERRLRRRCRFEQASMSRSGPIFDCYPEGSVIVIQWNVDHPFYQRVIDAETGKEFVLLADYLAFAFASAELKEWSEERSETMATLRATASNSLRTILS